jgi:esterase/lipase superfamily enzyme
MPTPNIYVGAATDPFADVVPAYRTTDVDVLYATDRVPGWKNGKLHYGWDRSASLGFGNCVVGIGRDVTWEQLVANSRTGKRDVSLPLSVRSITELGRFPDTPHLAPEAAGEEQRVNAAFLKEFGRRLALTPRKEAFMFVHGYHDSLVDAAYVVAELWHFLGREGVPLAYTWPAGHGGLLQGYEYDQDSSLFTVHHFKAFISLLASCPELESISIVAHSRGTAATTDALRELWIAARAADGDTKRMHKLENLILAAADIDMNVAIQRLAAERLNEAANRTTIYVSQHDKALGVASWLFADRRLGRLDYKDMTSLERAIIRAATRQSIVDARIPTSTWGHSYFHTSPAVSSDIILVLRYDKDPGAANGRPLTEIGPNYWEMDKGYPQDNE